MFQHSLFYENDSEHEMEGGELSSVTTFGGEYSSDEGEYGMGGGDNSDYETDTEIMLGGDDETINYGENYEGGGIVVYTTLLRKITEKNEREQLVLRKIFNTYKKINQPEELIKHLLIFYKHFAGKENIYSYNENDIQNIFVNPNKVNEIITSLNDYVSETTKEKSEINHEKIKEILFDEYE